MIQTTIGRFLKGEVDQVWLSGVYVFRDGEHVLYVGRSKDVVKRVYEHIEKWSNSAIGNLVMLNKPQCLSWQIELLEPKECREFAIPFAPIYKDRDLEVPIETAEEAMIRHYGPCMNTQINVNPHKLPKHIKWIEVDLAGITDNLF